MARSIERIQQDLAAMEDAIAHLALEFDTTYSNYLAFLAQAVRQQFMLASYQVCTQGYPESFLKLSFNQRQELQQTLREFAKDTQDQLISILDPLNDSTTETTDPSDPSPQLDLKPEPTQPKHVLEWQEKIEDTITELLQTLSLQTNQLLQKMEIIPPQLPVKVLEAAAKAEASGEANPGTANLLNLLVETKTDEESEDSTLTRIVAVHLRLSEIEFAEPTLTAGRTQLRTLTAKAHQLQREYRKIHHEQAIAQAEAAWRSSWYDDER